MKIQKLKPGDLIKITWIDANSPDPHSWIATENFRDTNPIMEIESVGFFIEKRAGFIRVAACRSSESEYTEVINRTLNIPVGCTRKVRKVRN